ncbi:MAG: type I restriction-modification system endonuclease [Blastocatellales bacterium]
MNLSQTNFAFLREHDEQLLRLGRLAEKYFADDPNTCLLKLRQFAEVMAQLLAARSGLYGSREENQYDLLRRLRDQGIAPREIFQVFDEVRRKGNEANHALKGDHGKALSCLKLCWQLGVWFHRTFKDAAFKSVPFVPPVAPPLALKDESEELRAELARLAKELSAYQATHQQTAQQLEATAASLKGARDERAYWEELAAEAERAKAELEQRLAALQTAAAAQPKDTLSRIVKAAGAAAEKLELDEASTRKLIDEQLRKAGWEADSETLRYGKGACPESGKNLAIAEWPTDHGPADYALFIGLTPVAVIEAKRKNIDVSAALQQAKRYSRDFKAVGDVAMPETARGEFRVPFAFSANGRPFLRQLETRSGIWFCDLRKPDNLSRALDGWYTPGGLKALLKRDEDSSRQKLAEAGFDYGFTIRDYQRNAIQAIERGVSDGRREMLLAMATGTGKTKTCIALIYRLLKAQRFRRVLFLVDREALGEQAANAFKDTRMENLQTFADTFGIKELDERTPDTDTMVHIATVQGMVQRALNPAENAAPPAVDQYDCIIVDECHRGYLLDRELSDTEMTFRDFDDYISKYRRVLDYFDAVKVGLTATPALHTTQIFGPPIFTYSYREAVIDGYLIDHEPPIQIKTELSQTGITWRQGEEVRAYDGRNNQIELFNAPDEITLEIEDFNRKVITEPFNKTVCEFLARELDPASPQKTLIFCANDAHADLVVKLLKEAFAEQYGGVEDDAVIKITGKADKPIQLIRRYKNERLPNVAVTVDLLTTGVDVPEICNLVFLRRVNSRILFDQMLGRATRLCDEVGKETFRIFDAVRIYEALQQVTAMQPVVVNPDISFTQLAGELSQLADEAASTLVRDQFIAKLQRKKRTMTEKSAQDFQTVTGLDPDAFIRQLRRMQPDEIAAWFAAPDGRAAALGEILDRKGEGATQRIFIADHEDKLHSVERGYGNATKPEDYLKEFADFIRGNRNSIPALVTVLTRPRELTRKQLRELALALDAAGFTEANLATAWREMTNQEIAARIVGYIRQAAIGDALTPFEQRVDRALQKILAAQSWTTPQRQWLNKIAAQTKANLIVDRDALDDPNQLFRREGGGFERLNRIFDGQLETVLADFNESLWEPAA